MTINLILVYRRRTGSALDSESFSRSSLPIGEDRSIVAVQALIHDGLAYDLENFFLGDIFTAHVVESEALLIFASGCCWQENLLVIFNFCNASSLSSRR